MSQAPDPVDRPSDSTPLSSQFPGEMPAPSTHSQEVPYRSLSILALVGFIIALVYSIIVGLLTVVGLISGSPALLAPWTLAVPALAIGICAVARWIIARSEGALAGEKLAKVGILLCLFLGLGSWAYRTAVFFAVRQQAQQAVEQWFTLMSQKQMFRAMRRTLPPDVQINYQDEEESLASELTLEFAKRSTSESGNPMDRFLSQLYVSQLRASGDKLEYHLVSTEKLQPTKRGYEVELRYHMKTPYSSFDMLIPIYGVESANNKYMGRRWAIQLMDTVALLNTLEPTPLGERIQSLMGDGRNFMFSWGMQLNTQPLFVDSYMSTLSPEQRKEAKKQLVNRNWASTVGGSPSLMVIEQELHQQPKKLLSGYDKYLRGEIIDLSQLTNASAAFQQQAKKTLKDFFESQGTSDLNCIVEPQPSASISWEYQENLLQLSIPVHITLNSAETGKVGLSGKILVQGQVNALSQSTPQPEWWIEQIIINGQQSNLQRPGP